MLTMHSIIPVEIGVHIDKKIILWNGKKIDYPFLHLLFSIFHHSPWVGVVVTSVSFKPPFILKFSLSKSELSETWWWLKPPGSFSFGMISYWDVSVGDPESSWLIPSLSTFFWGIWVSSVVGGSRSSSCSSSSDNCCGNFHPLGYFADLFFLWGAFLVSWHELCRCPVFWQIWHLKLCVKRIQANNPLLRSTSTHILGKV